MDKGYIPHLEVGTKASKSIDALNEYAQSISDVFETEFIDIEKEARANMRGYLLGPTLLSKAHMSGGNFSYARDERKIASTGLDLILVQIMLEGGDIRNVNGEAIKTRVGDVCISDLSRSFKSWTNDCTNFNFAIPRSLLNLSQSELDALHGLILPSNSSSAGLISSHAKYIWDHAPSINQHEANALANVAIGLISALTVPHIKSDQEISALISTQLIQIRRYIDDNISNPELKPDTLCKKFNMSRASLYRLFEPVGGVSDYIRARRLAKSLKYISEPLMHHKTLGVIAIDCGFGDLNVFSRAFKAYYGVSPSDARNIIINQNSTYQRNFEDICLSNWLKNINLTY